LTLTASNLEGPFYKPDAPFRASLLDEGIPGTRLVIAGQVLTADCAPVSGAVLDFWQAGASGEYDNAGYTLRGRQEADANGRYRLETVLPGEYPGRTPHIHVKVNAPGGPVLTTQIYFAGMPGNGTDSLFEPSLITTLITEADGSLSAPFNFILTP
jgi:protocatechuate 3,4-dioxygenase beta subunit